MLRLCCFLLIFMFAANSASAESHFMDGNWLHEKCQGVDGSADALSCKRYITGVFDGAAAVNNMFFCWPETATLGQAWDIVKKWLEDNPALRNMGGGKIVLSALKEAFPTKVMWQPQQRQEDGHWIELPVTPEKSTRVGEWVATCKGEYRYSATEGFPFIVGFPDNYEIGRAWYQELLSGPQ